MTVQEGEGAAEATATPTATPGGAAPAIVDSIGTVDGGRVRSVLTELRRSGPTVIANARLELVDTEREDVLAVAGTVDAGCIRN